MAYVERVGRDREAQNGISGFVAWSTGTVPLCSERGASSAAASSSEPCGACRGIDATTIVLD